MNEARIILTLNASVRTRVKVPIHPCTRHQRFEAEMVTLSERSDCGRELQ
ncbi:hypothetical protein [Xenorhabdus bovienii]|nr:hypothetical protein [Xenorhabdus bovienii]MDE1482206.1 hypothetical protein [Xenorhabdus bovienii]MDE9457411.1 hypothetical protein [Xenorhabdus bovienii]MDE9485591.1 hypothetical protein [Xenorhabdus bovienii]MDE9513702.1 hypothetical protein [Xenorhabdus bovienii]